MDKQDLVYLEARITMLEAFVFDSADKIAQYINLLEKVIERSDLDDRPLLKEHFERLLAEMNLRLQSRKE